MSRLRLTDVSLKREGSLLLQDISLTVEEGERWAVLGQNGCGKTTLLSLCGALQHPSSGTVEVLGKQLGRVDIFSELWPRLGHVQGRHQPSGRLTVGQIVLTGITGTNGLPLRWTATEAQQQQAISSLSSVGAARLLDRDWGSLSNGEQRRTLIARALVKAPDLLLLDEPAAGLDLPSREHLVDALEDLAEAQPSLASVLVTHHVEELPGSTTHVALMRSGRVLTQGPARQVLVPEAMSECFELPLDVGYDEAAGRWWARGLSRRARASGPRPASS